MSVILCGNDDYNLLFLNINPNRQFSLPRPTGYRELLAIEGHLDTLRRHSAPSLLDVTYYVIVIYQIYNHLGSRQLSAKI